MRMEIHILSSKVIKPSSPTPVDLRKYKLSFIDQLASPIHFGIIFFFPSSTAGKLEEEAFDPESYHHRLEISLSETLNHFYPLAGNFIKNDFSVDCNDHGVEVKRARVDGQLSEIVNQKPDTLLLDSLVPSAIVLARSVPCPVLAVQINIFPCGGLALGVRILHCIGDGISLLAFIKHWATSTKYCRGLDYRDIPVRINRPSFELASLFPGRKLVELKPDHAAAAGKNYTSRMPLITKYFLFDSCTISALKAEARAAGRPTTTTTHQPQAPSRVQVVTAHIWRTLIRISEAKHGHLRPSLLSFAMSLRGRIPMQVPENSYGTLVGHTTARLTTREETTELHALVSLLKNAIGTRSKDFANARKGDDIYKILINYYNEIGADCKPKEVDLYRFTSWCGFSCYEIDFGWGKPSWVANASKFVEMVLLLDAKSGDAAIEAWVTLNEQDMAEFERHHRHHLDQWSRSSKSKNCSKL